MTRDTHPSGRNRLEGLTAEDVRTVSYRYRGFGTVYDFPLYELDLPSKTITQSIDWGSDRQIVFEGAVTPAEILDVQQSLGGDEIAERLARLLRAAKRTRDSRHLVCDGGTTTLTVTFNSGRKYKVSVYDGPTLTEEQDRTLHALRPLAIRYGLGAAELEALFSR